MSRNGHFFLYAKFTVCKIVQGASFTCHSLVADSLTIGGGATAAAVPEPGSLILLMAGFASFGLWRWRRG